MKLLTPDLCACGCLQPILGAKTREGCLYNHWPNRRVGDSPSYVEAPMGYQSPCWLWLGNLNKWGYPKTKRCGVTLGAHRVFYEAYVGEITEGNDLDHLCRVRRCVRPDHLEDTTQVINIRRGLVPTLCGVQVEEIRRLYAAGNVSQYELARRFGVQQPEVSRIITGLRWRGVVAI